MFLTKSCVAVIKARTEIDFPVLLGSLLALISSWGCGNGQWCSWKSASLLSGIPKCISYLHGSVSHWLKIAWLWQETVWKLTDTLFVGNGVEQNLQNGKRGLRNERREREYVQVKSSKWTQASSLKHRRATWHVQGSTGVCIRPLLLSWLFVLWNNSGTILLSKNVVLQSFVQFSLNLSGSFTVWGM